jgi:NAD(P)-dependent dehydrogenase (short-subunit alcohol dehydrogenase family)
VEQFCEELNRQLPRLDFIVNNACQTVRRPPAYYRHLLDNEKKVSEMLSSNSSVTAGLIMSTSFSSSTSVNALLKDEEGVSSPIRSILVLNEDNQQNNDESHFPVGAYDVNAQQIDLRTTNSWILKLADVSTREMLEVTTCNALAPFILNARLKPLLIRARDLDAATPGKKDDGRYIVNVSAMEGKFYRRKNANHPHTNMCKAALNMMTRTSAQDYAEDKIYMNSVDTGW